MSEYYCHKHGPIGLEYTVENYMRVCCKCRKELIDTLPEVTKVSPAKDAEPCKKCKWHANRDMATGVGSDYPCNSCRTDKFEPIEGKE